LIGVHRRLDRLFSERFHQSRFFTILCSAFSTGCGFPCLYGIQRQLMFSRIREPRQPGQESETKMGSDPLLGIGSFIQFLLGFLA
jgi:hypothetical protein